MNLEIMREGIRVPAQSNLTWIFPVRLNGGIPVDWKVDSFDLGSWFKEEVGRYPLHEGGDEEERRDILKNWVQFEPRLRVQAEKEVQLGIKIGVDGMRVDSSEWSKAQLIPSQDLPPLNDLQRETAKSLGVSESEYARSLMAGWRSSELLLEKAKRVGSLVQERLSQLFPDAKLESVVLNTWDERFEVGIRVAEKSVPVRMRESVIDDLFEGGSRQAEESVFRVLDLAIGFKAGL